MWKRSLALFAVALLLVLGGCGQLTNSSSTASTGTTSNRKVQTTGNYSTTGYNSVVTEGHYKTSAARGVAADYANNALDVKGMETGLMQLSQDVFSPNKYTFQEGQYISAANVKNWLGRKSKSNATGLNPEANGSTDPDKRVPEYLGTMVEQDYMTGSGSKLSLGGISIALGMNAVDYYQKEQYGATFQTKVNKDKQLQEGKTMAQEIVDRLRAKNNVGNVPIFVTIYSLAEQDSLVSGSFIAKATATGKTIDKWDSVDQQSGVLPTVNNQKPINSADATAFNNFKTQVQNFFPNLSGVTASVHYLDGALTQMTVNIQTQFYGQTEIMSFTNYVASVANKLLPGNAPIQIIVSSVNTTQALITRNSGEKEFTTNVLQNY
ncbi:CamS family sex pheromone protein [Schleiferilactobacillus perolens]|jgi:protein involved in sex pheromone biosynthesis|nr:CamS family sex pheromone protein [Schleiferilactobacillus perolens]MCI1891185.1 CamS family sex pheromone protein [Schleiferilactobacillus harbinensis]MCI1911877.1 CamS family sex pheromone protein [Schleiferilactobacillus harbinensis]MCI2171648.1 CamS family sex pheromone protein [Schleiferilactobacillus perolens]